MTFFTHTFESHKSRICWPIFQIFNEYTEKYSTLKFVTIKSKKTFILKQKFKI